MCDASMPDRKLKWSDIPGWFPFWNRAFLRYLITKYSVRTVTEVGSFLGRSTLWFANEVDTVHAVDRFHEIAPYDPKQPGTREKFLLVHGYHSALVPGACTSFEHIFTEHVKRTGCMSRVKCYQGNCLTVAPLTPEVDLVYLDAEHSYKAVLDQLVAYLPKARKVICGDDFDRESVQYAVYDIFGKGYHSFGRFWWYER